MNPPPEKCPDEKVLDQKVALPLLERLNRLPVETAPPRDVGARRIFLARALWESRGDRRRARQLAAESQGAFTSAGPGHEEHVAEVKTWIARHRR